MCPPELKPDAIPSWDQFFMNLARVYATKSKDPSTKVGAVIIGPHKEQRSGGYNGLPRGLDDSRPERFERPHKYLWSEHAERNALFNAARIGIATDGCSLYVTSLPPCTDCARAIIQAGIKMVVCESLDCPDRWKEDIEIALAMLKEASVEVRKLGG